MRLCSFTHPVPGSVAEFNYATVCNIGSSSLHTASIVQLGKDFVYLCKFFTPENLHHVALPSCRLRVLYWRGADERASAS
jgi:hypothetical protein